MSSFPKITINDVNNTNLDSVTKQITGLQDDQVYNIRAILKNNSTNQQVIIPRVLDDTGAVFQFRTPIDEIISMSAGVVNSSFTSLDFPLTNFNSNKTTTLYDIEFLLYQWVGGTYVNLPGNTQTLTDISNADFNPPPASYPSITFSGISYDSKYKCSAKIFNKSSGNYYNGGQEILIFQDQLTSNYIILTTINTASTVKNAKSVTLYFSELKDNTSHVSSLFNTIRFYMTNNANGNRIFVDRTNVSFVDIADSMYSIKLSNLLANTSYSFSGDFSRNTLYTNLFKSFNYSVTTDSYDVTWSSISSINISTDTIQFRLLGLVDNVESLHFDNILFNLYKTSDLSTSVGLSPYEHLNVPINTTRLFSFSGLEEDVEYKIVATFVKNGVYSVVKDIMVEETISSTLNASIIIDDDGVSTTTTSVNFTISDFESPDYPSSNTHSIVLIAITPAQAIGLGEGSVAHWDFASNELVDYFGNTLLINPVNINNYTFDDSLSLTTQTASVSVFFTPTDWAIFNGLGNDFKQTIDIMIPTSAVQDKFHAYFQNTGSDLGFTIRIYENTLFYQGYCRSEDGNIVELIFNIQYTLPANFYDNRQVIQLEYETFLIGSNDINTNAWCKAILKIDNIEVANFFQINTANYSASTQTNGVYIYQAGGNLSFYNLSLHIPGTKLYELKIGSLSGNTY